MRCSSFFNALSLSLAAKPAEEAIEGVVHEAGEQIIALLLQEISMRLFRAAVLLGFGQARGHALHNIVKNGLNDGGQELTGEG